MAGADCGQARYGNYGNDGNYGNCVFSSDASKLLLKPQLKYYFIEMIETTTRQQRAFLSQSQSTASNGGWSSSSVPSESVAAPDPVNYFNYVTRDTVWYQRPGGQPEPAINDSVYMIMDDGVPHNCTACRL